MSYLKNIIQEEHQRLKALSNKYREEIDSLPRGSISIKTRSSKEYLYLARRDKGKVQFRYIGPVTSEHSQDMLNKVAQRKEYEIKLKQVKKDLRETEKIINGRKI